MLKALVGFRSSLEAVESHIYVTIPVVYKVVRSIEQHSWIGSVPQNVTQWNKVHVRTTQLAARSYREIHPIK